MITENEVRELAAKYLDGVDFVVRRSNGGWSKPCGFSVKILDDVPGTRYDLFLHDDNTYQKARSSMIEFSEDVLTPAE